MRYKAVSTKVGLGREEWSGEKVANGSEEAAVGAPLGGKAVPRLKEDLKVLSLLRKVRLRRCSG